MSDFHNSKPAEITKQTSFSLRSNIVKMFSQTGQNEYTSKLMEIPGKLTFEEQYSGIF